MDQPFNQAEINELKEVFAVFDKDHNGSVSLNDLRLVMNQLGRFPTEPELYDMIREVNKNGSGSIEFNDFLGLMNSVSKKQGSENDLQDAFNVFDADADGRIGVNDLKKVIQSLGESLSEAEISDLFQVADHDKDGFINFKEFSQLMNSI